MSSAEYLVTSIHTPLDPSFRTWERPTSSTSVDAIVSRPTPSTPAQHAMGPAVAFTGEEEKLSGVLDPRQLRVRHPDGLPRTEKQVEVTREKSGSAKRGIRYNVLDEEERRAAPKPVFKEDHVWG